VMIQVFQHKNLGTRIQIKTGCKNNHISIRSEIKKVVIF